MIGIGIIGAGHFGAVHARAIADVEGIRLAASCRGEGAQRLAQEFGGTAHADWPDLLADPSVDAVVIATPHDTHEEIAIAAANAGKHILLEKPMAPTPEACDAIIAAADGAGVALMAGHVMHFSQPCLVARDIIASGDLGRPILGTSAMIKFWMESNRSEWHTRFETGGGMLMTAGIHALDRLVFLMGDRVAGVNALYGTFFHDQPADDTALLSLRFANGGFGQVQSVGYRDGKMISATTLVCEHGMLALDFVNGVSVGRGESWEQVPGSIEPDWMHRAMLREWDAMREAIAGAAPKVPNAHARHVVDIIAASRRADAERREIALAEGAD